MKNIVTLVIGMMLSLSVLVDAAEMKLKNAGFEDPKVEKETGVIKGWNSNSMAGTGTWPVGRANAEGEAKGKNVGVIHKGGHIGQVIHDADGNPLKVKPGKSYQVKFLNLRHNEWNNVNMGIYLTVNDAKGGRVAEPVSFLAAKNQPGEVTLNMTMYSEATLDAKAKGWRNGAVYLHMANFVDRIVLDEVRFIEAP